MRPPPQPRAAVGGGSSGAWSQTPAPGVEGRGWQSPLIGNIPVGGGGWGQEPHPAGATVLTWFATGGQDLLGALAGGDWAGSNSSSQVLQTTPGTPVPERSGGGSRWSPARHAACARLCRAAPRRAEPLPAAGTRFQGN